MMTTLYTNVNLFQGTTNQVLENAWFTVNDDGRISEVGNGQLQIIL